MGVVLPQVDSRISPNLNPGLRLLEPVQIGDQMSGSLESLMRQTLVESDRPAPATGLVAFILIGGGGALAFVVLSAAAIAIPTGLPKWLVSALCYAALVVPVYLLHRRYSFGSGAPHTVAFPRYVAVQMMALLLAAVFSLVAYGIFALPTVPAALLVLGLTSGINFIVLRRWAFAADGR